MKERFKKAVFETTEFRALLILGLLLCFHAWHMIPKLRPNHLAIPATIAIIATLTIAAYTPFKFLLIFSIGLFIVLAVVMFPMLRQPQKPTAHWIHADE